MTALEEHINQVKKKEIDIVDYTKRALKEAKKINKEYNYFNTISEELALECAKKVAKNPKGKLAGVLVSVKDCICVKDVESTAGSAILKGYKPVFNSTVAQKIMEEGGIIIGKTSQDAFGFGGMNLNVGKGFSIPKNPFDKNRVCGGSSGGSAGFTQKFNFAHISIAESTGGSIVNPASFCGVYGLSPTYGLVSRYGLIDYANSLDKIGVMAKEIEDVQLGLSVIEGYDEKDQTSLKIPRLKDSKIKTVGIIKESLDVDKEVKQQFKSAIEKLKYEIKEVSLPFVREFGLASYYTIALAEASTNLARYCGMRYGAEEKIKGDYNSYFTNIRSKNFDTETKRRLMIGTFVRQAGYRDAYYLKAQKVRTQIIQEYKKTLDTVDILITPTMPILAPTFPEAKKLTPLKQFMMDFLTVGPNLAGLPHLNIPIGFSRKNPVGLLAITNHLNEEKLFTFSNELKK